VSDQPTFGVRCKCGGIASVEDASRRGFATLEEAIDTLRKEGWQQLIVHLAPPGCGGGVWCLPDDLLLKPK
jgi:hypothetical protein